MGDPGVELIRRIRGGDEAALDRQQVEASTRGRGAAWSGGVSAEESVLKRAMAARDAAAVFAEATERGEVDRLTDPDVRLWVGLRPLEGSA